jgi:hypothetical protein
MKRLLLQRVSLRQTMWACAALAALPLAGLVLPRLGGCPCRMPVPLGGPVALEAGEIHALVAAREEQLEELFSLYCKTIHDVRHHEHEPEWFSGRAHLKLAGEVDLERVEPDPEDPGGVFARFLIDGELAASLCVSERARPGSSVYARGSSYLCRLAARRAFDALLATEPDASGEAE